MSCFGRVVCPACWRHHALYDLKDRVMTIEPVFISKNCLNGCIMGSVYLPSDVVVAQVSYS